MNTEIDIIPYFQPIISMSKKDITGVEVLARGVNAQGAILLPGQLFEGTDIETHRRIDRIVREKAFSYLAQLPENRRIFINMMPSHFFSVQDVEKTPTFWQHAESSGLRMSAW